MNRKQKAGVVVLNLLGAAILVAAVVDAELRVPGLVFVVIVCFLWERTRE